MSKRVRVDYVCDYCGKSHNHYHDFKYSDNSGLNDKEYDICSDECYKKHLEYLKQHIGNDKIEIHVKNYVYKRN